MKRTSFFILLLVFFHSSFGQLFHKELPSLRGKPDWYNNSTVVAQPMTIPETVLIEMIRNQIGYSSIKVDTAELVELRNNVKACKIKLTKAGESGILVFGDSTWSNSGFWVFKTQGKKWDLLLMERGLYLNLKDLPQTGYRQIEIIGCLNNACRHRVHNFNGTEYVPCDCYDENEKGKHPFNCPTSYKGPWPKLWKEGNE